MSATPQIRDDTLLKFLTADGRGQYSGVKWHLPTAGRAGRWMPRTTGALRLCENGFHVTTPAHAPRWIAAALYTVEVDGERLDGGDKIAAQRARLLARVEAWNERTTCLFACDCAEHVLPLFEKRRPDDARPRTAIAVARRYANGEATREELLATSAAADAAAHAYAYAADAAHAAHAAHAAAAAYAAAAYAAYAAAYAADAAHAEQAERDWQAARFLEYVSGVRA